MHGECLAFFKFTTSQDRLIRLFLEGFHMTMLYWIYNCQQGFYMAYTWRWCKQKQLSLFQLDLSISVFVLLCRNILSMHWFNYCATSLSVSTSFTRFYLILNSSESFFSIDYVTHICGMDFNVGETKYTDICSKI